MEATMQRLWVMLRREDKDITYEQALELANNCPNGILYVINKTLEATNAALISKSPNAEAPAKEKKPGLLTRKKN
jgi:hypothetical protein